MYSSPQALRLAEAPGNIEWKHGTVSAAMLTAMTTWYPPTDPNPVELNYEYADNLSEVNGEVLASSHFLESKNGTVGRRYNMTAETSAMNLARILGNIQTSSPSTQQSEVKQLQISGAPSSGRFIFIYLGRTTVPINITGLTAGAMQTALETLFGSGNVTVTAAAPNYNIAFTGTLANRNIAELDVVVTDPLNTGTLQVLTTTPGRAAGVRTHHFRWPPACTIFPPTFAQIEAYACGANTDTYKLNKGGVLESWSIEIGGKTWIEESIDVRFDGTELNVRDLVPGWNPPTSYAPRTPFFGQHVQLWVGPNADTFAAADKISYSDIRNIRMGIGAGVTEPTTIGGGTAVQGWRYGDNRPDHTLEMTFLGDKAHRLYKSFINGEWGERTKARLLIDPGVHPQRRFEYYAAQLLVIAAPNPQGNENQLTFTFMPESNAVNGGPAEFWVENDIVGYGIAI